MPGGLCGFHRFLRRHDTGSRGSRDDSCDEGGVWRVHIRDAIFSERAVGGKDGVTGFEVTLLCLFIKRSLTVV